MNYKIINSGSKGNATIVENIILIDCGLPYKTISEYADNLKLVLLTHIHKDHFHKTAIKRLAMKRPTLRFVCGEWLVENLIECGVSKNNIDILNFDEELEYSDNLKIYNFELLHDVPNCGYAILINGFKYFYATDTNKIDHIIAEGFDMYFIEGNYENEKDLELRKQKHLEKGEFSYEERVSQTHLSQVKATEWLMKNMKENSKYIFMHQHKEEEENV